MERSLQSVQQFIKLPGANRYIVSVDLGIKYFAYTTLDVRKQVIIDWCCMVLPHHESPLDTSSKLHGKSKSRQRLILDRNLTWQLWNRKRFGIPETHEWSMDNVMIIMEQQIAHNQEMNDTSAALTAYCREKNCRYLVLDTYTRLNYMHTRLESSTNRNSTRLQVKQSTCDLVQNRVLAYICNELASVFKTAYKKDDLADCMIQLLAAIDVLPMWLQLPDDHNSPGMFIPRKRRSRVKPVVDLVSPRTKQRATGKRLRSGPSTIIE